MKFLTLYFILSLLMACGVDKVPPLLNDIFIDGVSVRESNLDNVPLNALFRLEFSDGLEFTLLDAMTGEKWCSIRSSSAQSDTFPSYDPDELLTGIECERSCSIMELHHDAFEPGESYSLYILDNIKDSGGNPLDTDSGLSLGLSESVLAVSEKAIKLTFKTTPSQ